VRRPANGENLFSVDNADEDAHAEYTEVVVDATAYADDALHEPSFDGFLNVCDPGLACMNAEVVPGCASARCCSPFLAIFESIRGPIESLSWSANV
jgi:hypothetical protein